MSGAKGNADRMMGKALSDLTTGAVLAMSEIERRDYLAAVMMVAIEMMRPIAGDNFVRALVKRTIDGMKTHPSPFSQNED